jgi:tetratricopeptide (TPR) repeat protein
MMLAAAAWAQAPGRIERPSPLEQGKKAREAGKLEESTRLLRGVVAKTPGAGEAWWYLGLNGYDRDEFGLCAEAFGKVFALDAKNGGAAAFLGLCEFRLGQYETAFSHLVMARRAGLIPGSELEKVAHHHYLLLLNQIGQFEMASSLLAEAARATPEMPFLKEMCGLASLRIAKTPMAIQPDEREAVDLAGRAAMLAFQRRVGEAKPLAEDLLAKYPNRANVNYLRGYLALLEASPESLTYFERELAIAPGHVQARLQIAYEYLRRGESAKGLPYAAAAAKLAPEDFTARNIYGRLLLDAEKADEAAQELEMAVKLAPTSPEAHFSLASAYNRLGRKVEAQRHRDIFSQLEKERKK